VASDVELLEAEVAHQRDLVARHGALGIRLVILCRLRFGAFAVATQVWCDDGEVAGE
jgi:hypothetical protein